KEIGKVVFVKGQATVIRTANPQAKQLSFGASILPLDTLQTGAGALKILFEDKTVLSLGDHSKVLITEYLYQPSQGTRRSIFDIIKGTVRTIVEPSALKNDQVELQTETAVAGIRGTDVGIHVLSATAAQFLCFDGKFETYFKENPAEKVMVETGTFTEVHGATITQPAAITAGQTQEFAPHLEAPKLNDVLKQSKPINPPPAEVPGVIINAPPKSAAEQGFQETSTPEQTMSPTQETPPLIPGGGDETPSDAGSGSSTTGPMKVPVTFPGGAS
ncbi:MAG: FecR domain-containing protein, partial [Deltaproteobacteria bacterium]|nr:FecR domain-containing protein [Deltaproteobacteria bacterium]